MAGPDLVSLRRRRTPEASWWLFMRVSGVLLVVLVLGHVLDRHVIHDYADVGSEFVIRRWRHPLWRVWDGALVGLGILHGAHGVRTVVEDLVSDPGRRALAVTSVSVVAGFALLLAAVTVLGA